MSDFIGLFVCYLANFYKFAKYVDQFRLFVGLLVCWFVGLSALFRLSISAKTTGRIPFKFHTYIGVHKNFCLRNFQTSRSKVKVTVTIFLIL